MSKSKNKSLKQQENVPRRNNQKIYEGRMNQNLMIPPALNTSDFLKAYGEIGWLFACVSKIAQNVGDSEWKAYRNETLIENTRALSVLERPNPYMSQYDLLERTSMFLDLRGTAFWYIAKDKLGRPKEIWCISPLDMVIIPDKTDYVKGYIYRAGADQVPLNKDEVIFFNLPDPANPYGGIGAAQAAANSLETDKFSAQWNRNFFYNSAEPAGILIVPEISDDEYDRMTEQWNDKYRGVDNAKRTAIVRGVGSPIYTSIQVNQKDMDFLNLRQMSRDEILGAFGIHKSILGITDDVNRANAETAEYSFAKHVIRPRLRKIQDKLNNELAPMFNENIKYKFTDPVPENKDFVKSLIDSQTDKSITKNEARRIINKLIGENLDPVEGGDVIYQPVSMQKMGTQLPAAAEPVDNAPNSDNANEPIAKKGIFSYKTKMNISKIVGKNNALRHENFLKMSQPLIDEYEKVIQKYLKEMQKEIASKVLDNASNPVDLSKWNKELQNRTAQLYVKCFKAAGDDFMSEFKAIEQAIQKEIDVLFDVRDRNVQQAIKDKLIKVKDINKETADQIKEIFEEMYDSPDFTVADIAARLADEDFPAFNLFRCKRIAQTEVLGSVNAGTYHAYSQNADLVDGKAWLATYEHTRESHIMAGLNYNEEKAIPVNEHFIVSGYKALHPLDPNLPAGEVVNCKCCMMPVIKF